jgi:hypothetical protein
MLSPSSTCHELWEPNCYKASGWELRGHQLGRCWTPYLHQQGVGYVLSSTVTRYVYSRRSLSSCMVLDPLGTEAVHWPGHLLGAVAKMFWVSLLTTFSNFTYLFLCCTILILSCTHEHFHLAEAVSIEMANIVFDKAVQKVIKDAIKHSCLVSTALYYTQVL